MVLGHDGTVPLFPLRIGSRHVQSSLSPSAYAVACSACRRDVACARMLPLFWKAKLLWDTNGHVYRRTRVLALPVGHPNYHGPLWLVVARHGKGHEPWYLLTNEPVETDEQAWDIVFSYVRRWKIEESFRFQKTQLVIPILRLPDREP